METRSILLVEDDPDDERLIRMSLEAIGVGNAIAVARDGQEALDAVFGPGGAAGAGSLRLPLVVIMDLHLPKIDGLEVLQRIRRDERTKLLPIVILTSSKEESDRLESYKLGANSYVCKPVDFSDFNAAVKSLGHYWALINMPARG